MAPFGWIQTSSLLILTLQFKGTTEQHSSTRRATAGRDVTLPCKNLIQRQQKCRNTTWLFTKSGNTATLFELGKKKEVKPKSDRLRLSSKCFLIIKKVTDQDAGPYICRQFKNKKDHEESQVLLSVLNSKNAATTKKTITRTLPTTQSAKPTMKINTRTTALNSPAEWLWLIIVSVGLAAFLITAVVIIGWKKTKEKTQQGNNTGLSLNPTDTQCGPGTSQDTAEVSYASITFTRKTKTKAQVRGDDDGDTVIYSIVKYSSSPAGVSADPSDLCSTINKASKCS